MSYYAEVVRTRDPMGPGKLTLYKDHEPVGQWDCITGGDQTDPKILGGLCPPIAWMMIEPIKMRPHPKRHTMEMARIIPIYDGKMEYNQRTFSIHDWPFMIHVAGSSSGCIAIERSQWRECVNALNNAWHECTFEIMVIDQQA